MDVKARVTVFAEGTRGHLAKGLIRKLGLDEGKKPPALRDRDQGDLEHPRGARAASWSAR